MVYGAVCVMTRIAALAGGANDPFKLVVYATQASWDAHRSFYVDVHDRINNDSLLFAESMWRRVSSTIVATVGDVQWLRRLRMIYG